MERTKIHIRRNGSKGDSNPGYLDCESGIVPLSLTMTFVMRVDIDIWQHTFSEYLAST